jgi:SAM-dependent methyltransferase
MLQQCLGIEIDFVEIEAAMNFVNVYDNARRAVAYSKLEFANTYHLAFRDLPEIFRTHVKGTAALDFGCGTGRSTRFLRGLGFDPVGVDISEEMLARALGSYVAWIIPRVTSGQANCSCFRL